MDDPRPRNFLVLPAIAAVSQGFLIAERPVKADNQFSFRKMPHFSTATAEIIPLLWPAPGSTRESSDS